MPAVGRNVLRKEGKGKVNGAAKYIDDLSFPAMLHGTTIRSTIPAGRIRSVRLEFEPAGFVVADARDIPGKNVIALIEDDQPCLADGRVRHVAEPILLVAHENREALLGARASIDYEVEAAVEDPALSPRVFKEILIEKGDLDRGFARADRVVEGEYRTGHQEQLYIEC
ncbi:MAG: molybdopterin cofactor-binding domain-containing protein, partial [Acidobacteriota bacterium]